MTESRHVVTCNGRSRAAASDGHRRRVRGRRALPRVAAAELPAPDHPGARAARVRLVDTWNERSLAAARITSPIPAAAASRPSRSTLRSREPPAGAILRRSATRRDRWPCPPRSAIRTFPLTLDLRRPPAAERRRRPRARVAMSSITRRSGTRAPVAVSPRVPADRRRVRRDARRSGPAAPARRGVRPTVWRRSGRTSFSSRRDNARRAIRENGVTYNVYGDPQGIDRPWELDLVPLLISADEWSRSREGPDPTDAAAQPDPAGLTARSGCSGRPAAAVARAGQSGVSPALPRHSRAARHLPAPARVDLAASPDGQWAVLADRTQAPSGAGYALENRHRDARTACPKRFATATSSGWPRSSARSATR